MAHIVRRDVKWGPSISRSSIPYGLSLTMRSNLTVFNVDKFWPAIYHTLYPAFTRGDYLYLSAKIRQNSEIRNKDVYKVFRGLSQVEALGRCSSAPLGSYDLEEAYAECDLKNDLTLTTKSQFHSPGDIWAAISLLGNTDTILVSRTLLFWIFIYGNGYAGRISPVLKAELEQLRLSKLNQDAGLTALRASIEGMMIKLPSYETSVIEKADNDSPTKRVKI